MEPAFGGDIFFPNVCVVGRGQFYKGQDQISYARVIGPLSQGWLQQGQFSSEWGPTLLGPVQGGVSPALSSYTGFTWTSMVTQTVAISTDYSSRRTTDPDTVSSGNPAQRSPGPRWLHKPSKLTWTQRQHDPWSPT